MRVPLSVGCVLLVAVGCAHTGEKNADATAPQSTESAGRARKPSPKAPPLAASPSETMKPGSQEQIARALASKGAVDRDDVRGERLTAALRKFQESQGLAATGFPDHETLLRLGIDPKEVDTSLENVSGTQPGETGKGGSGDGRSGKDGAPHHAAPPKDTPGRPEQDSEKTGG